MKMNRRSLQMMRWIVFFLANEKGELFITITREIYSKKWIGYHDFAKTVYYDNTRNIFGKVDWIPRLCYVPLLILVLGLTGRGEWQRRWWLWRQWWLPDRHKFPTTNFDRTSCAWRRRCNFSRWGESEEDAAVAGWPSAETDELGENGQISTSQN